MVVSLVCKPHRRCGWKAPPRPLCDASRGGRQAPFHSSCSWEELRLKLAKLPHLSEPVSGQEAGPGGSAGGPLGARTSRPGRHVWGLLPGTSDPRDPSPSSSLVPFAPRHPQFGAPRRPTGADARAAGLRRSASFCHLEPLAPAGSLTLSLNLRSLSELSRQGVARPSASNQCRACRLPGTPPGPRDPALHHLPPGHRRPNFLRAVCARRLGVWLPC